ncbi:BAR domain containing protein [Trichuris trichiura]|uniref:BAR domain containing protein n=1 Tax=Trichuris trichiura TaxID=36087 RepID=A0A077ZD18_TRITR|nr:BAR domain containing protein [Trichuris trichiura]
MKLGTILHHYSTRIGYAIGLTERTELDKNIRALQIRFEKFGESLRDFCDKMTNVVSPSTERSSRSESFAQTLDFIACKTDRTLPMNSDVGNLASCVQAIVVAEHKLQRDMETKVLKPSRDFLENEWKEFKTAERDLANATLELDSYKSKLTKLIKSNASYQKGYEKVIGKYEKRLEAFVIIVNKLNAYEIQHAERIKDAVDILIEYHKLALRKFRIYIAFP